MANLPISRMRGASAGGSALRKQRFYTRNQFARAKRLRHVVVRAHLQPNHPVGFIAARRQHQHRQPVQRLLLANFAANLKAGHLRQHEIE